MSPDGRCELRLTRRYDAEPRELWRALTEPESLSRWLAPPPGVTTREVEPGRVLELDWRPPGEEPSLVRLEISPDGEGAKLVIEHARIEAQLGMRYMRIWTQRLAQVVA